MNELIIMGVVCLIGLGLYCAPKVARFIESFIKFHFGGRF
jgi:hypothetical protein